MKVIFSGYQEFFFPWLKWPGHDAVQSPVACVYTSGPHMPSQSTSSHSGLTFHYLASGHTLDQMQHSTCRVCYDISVFHYAGIKLAQSNETKLGP